MSPGSNGSNPLNPYNIFRVDSLIRLSDGKDVQAFIDQFPHLPNPFFDPQLFVEESSGKVYSKVLGLYHSIRRLYEEHVKNSPQPTFHTSLYEWDDDDPLADVFLATFGGFPPKEDTGTDYRGLIEKYIWPRKRSPSLEGYSHPILPRKRRLTGFATWSFNVTTPSLTTEARQDSM